MNFTAEAVKKCPTGSYPITPHTQSSECFGRHIAVSYHCYAARRRRETDFEERAVCHITRHGHSEPKIPVFRNSDLKKSHGHSDRTKNSGCSEFGSQKNLGTQKIETEPSITSSGPHVTQRGQILLGLDFPLRRKTPFHCPST